jgi:hypothetical protein
LDCVNRALDPGHNSKTASAWQESGEHLEHRPTARRTVAERSVEHRELVSVGMQCRGGAVLYL